MVQRDGKGARKTLERSLRRLQCDTIDLIQLHDCRGSGYDRAIAPGGAVEELEKARSEGKVVEIGITAHSDIDVMRRAIESGKFATIMVAYNLLDSERVGAEVVPSAHEHGMGVICMKPLAGGRLADSRGTGMDPVRQKGAGLAGPVQSPADAPSRARYAHI